MSNPNLVRKIADSPSGGSGEIDHSAVHVVAARDKNYLINGNFDIWQRGTSFSIGGGNWFQYYYGPDRWFNQSGSNTLATVTRQSSGLVDSIYCLRWTAGGVTEQCNVSQALEDIFVNSIKGKYVTFSLKARVNIGNSRNYAIQIFKNTTPNTKNGGTWSLIAQSTLTTLTTSFQTLKVTVLIPNDGSANGLRVALSDSSTGLAADYVEITDAMLVETTSGIDYVPNSFIRVEKSYISELYLCQRYYEKSFEVNTAPANGSPGFFSTNSGLVHKGLIPWVASPALWGERVDFKVEKRAFPAVVRYGDNNGYWCYNVVGSFANSTTRTFSNSIGPGTTDKLGFTIDNNVSTSALNGVLGHWTADAEL